MLVFAMVSGDKSAPDILIRKEKSKGSPGEEFDMRFCCTFCSADELISSSVKIVESGIKRLRVDCLMNSPGP